MNSNFFENVASAVKYWYIPLITGLILVGVGLWTFTSPMESYVALSIIFSVSFLVSGLMESFFAISNRKTMKNWGWSLALGILTLIVGFLLIRDPEMSMATLPFYVGFMLMFRSAGAIGYAFDLKDSKVLDWGNLLAVGILGLLFSFILIWNPAFAGLNLVVWTGLAFIFSGFFSIYLSIRLGKLHKKGKKIKEKLEK